MYAVAGQTRSGRGMAARAAGLRRPAIANRVGQGWPGLPPSGTDVKDLGARIGPGQGGVDQSISRRCLGNLLRRENEMKRFRENGCCEFR
jgi:hypothetical protein